MSSATTNNSRMHISDVDANAAYDRMAKADAGDLNRQITGIMILRVCGALLGIVFLAVNSYQATWALMKLSGAAGGAGIYGGDAGLSADQWTIGATAFGLIFAAQVIAVRMVLAQGVFWRVSGIFLLVGLMAFSTVTSAIHIGFSIQGGVVEATRQSDDYKLAKSRYEAAIASKATKERNWSLYQEDNRGGDPWSLNATHSQGPGRPYVEGINSAGVEVEAARRAYQQVKASGGGSAMGDVVGAVAGWFGTTTENFALGFGIFTVILMEGVRVYLSLLTGIYLMQVMNEIGRKRRAAEEGGDTKEQNTPAEKKAPRKSWLPEWSKKKTAKPTPPKVMASSTPKATESVRGPLLRDPIEVEDDAPAPRPSRPPLVEKKEKPAPAPEPEDRPKKEPKDTAPGGKRQANFSVKLAKLRKAVKDGTIAPGAAISFATITELVGGNKDTKTALRNALAKEGVAHWQGKRLIAGKA